MQPNYIIHPITIDALLQTALVASSGGLTSQLRCMVRTAIEQDLFRAADAAVTEPPTTIDAISKNVGPGSINVAAELRAASGAVLVQVKDVSAVAHDSAAE